MNHQPQYAASDFPFPGEHVLSKWVQEEVYVQLRHRATDEEVLEGVKDVLERHEREHGARPVRQAS